MSQVFVVIGCKKIELDKFKLGVIKRKISGDKYKKYNNEAYEKKYLRREIITRYIRKVSDWTYKGKT